MTAPFIAVADSVFPSLEPAEKVLARIGARLQLAAAPTPEAILEIARKADGLMVTFGQLTAAIIENLENCKVIGRFGIGVDNIDLAAATKAGIQVVFVPDYCLDEVSDHALSLMLSLARKIDYGNALVQQGRWEAKAMKPIYRLRGRTMGLVGLGKIPQALVPKAQAFGLKVIASDPFIAPEAAAALGVELVSFEALLERSDYISIHAPLTPKTRHLFNQDAFRRMKCEAILLNTARGPLIDEEALAAALDAGEIAGAGLDVVTTEPLERGSPLLGRDNVLITPHAAFYSEEALIELQTKCAEDVARVLTGEAPVYPANKLG